MRVGWYRFTATFGRRWGGYLTLVLLIGLIGGIALGSVAAARRTQSSYATFLASTRPSDLSLTVQGPNLTGKLAHLPGVQRAEAALYSLNAFPLTRTGAPIIPAAFRYGEAFPVGSIDGEYFGQDRVTVTVGRMARPDRADEFVATAQAAHLLGWHVGQVIPMGFYTNAQSPTSKPLRRLEMRLTGIVVFNNEVVLDDVDRFPAFVLFTPALTRPFSTGPESVYYGLKLADGARGVPAVEQEIIRALPRGATASFHLSSVVAGQVNRTVEPEAIALAVFGVIAMLAVLLVSAQVVARQIRETYEETAVLRALGASRLAVMGDSLFGILGAVVAGSLLAAGVAVGLSPLSPSARCARSIPRRGWQPTRRCSASDSLRSSPAWALSPSCSPPGRQRAAARRARHGLPAVRASRGWPRTPARPFPRSLVSGSRLSPAAAAPRCQSAQRCWAPRWPSRSSSPRSPSAAG